MVDNEGPLGGNNWMTVEDDQKGEEYIEAHLIEEAAPDGTVSDQISPLNVAYPLMPEEGGYGSAKFLVTINQTEAPSEVTHEVSERSSKFSAQADVYKAGEWGYKIRLYDVESNDEIGSLQAGPSFDEDNQLKEGVTVYLTIELQYDHDYTKQFTGFTESRLQAARDESREWRESIREDWERGN